MIVEGQGMGLWTRVRLPPNPLKSKAANPLKGVQIAVYKNIFALVVYM